MNDESEHKDSQEWDSNSLDFILAVRHLAVSPVTFSFTTQNSNPTYTIKVVTKIWNYQQWFIVPVC